MYARVNELLSLPDRLRALPEVASDPDGWLAVQQKLARQARRTQRRAVVARFAAAASIATIGLFAGLKLLDSSPGQLQSAPVTNIAAEDSVATLRARSRALEELLAALPSRPAVERADTSLPIETLEAQVQWLDHQLSLAGPTEESAPNAERLWRDRVEVMNSLVQLRYVEAQRVVL